MSHCIAVCPSPNSANMALSSFLMTSSCQLILLGYVGQQGRMGVREVACPESQLQILREHRKPSGSFTIFSALTLTLARNTSPTGRQLLP